MKAVVLAMAVVLSGCTTGYEFRSAHSERVRSIAVPVFRNTSFEQGVDVQLTEAVVKQINRSTGWAVVDESRAQTVLTGTVTGVSIRPLSTSRRTGYVEEVAIQITVDFEWRDNGTGEVLVGRRGFAGSGTFIADRGVGERIEAGEYGAIDQLARDIVGELRSAW